MPTTASTSRSNRHSRGSTFSDTSAIANAAGPPEITGNTTTNTAAVANANANASKTKVKATVLYEDADADADELEPLVDLTQPIPLHSKKTDRKQKRREKKEAKRASTVPPRRMLDLPYELLYSIITFVEPRELFVLCRVNKTLQHLILSQEHLITRDIIAWRYPSLSKCFRLPVLAKDLDENAHRALNEAYGDALSPRRVNANYKHVQPPDPSLVCFCYTCRLRWIFLCVVVDFAHWQDDLDSGVQIPTIPRGADPEWNKKLVAKHAQVVVKALHSQLWYVRLLQAHLTSITRSIQRNSANQGNRRSRFRMTAADVASGTDAFLDRSGPPTADFPYNRDNYDLLEAFMPSRSWIKDDQKWVYVPADQHEQDLARLERQRQDAPPSTAAVSQTTPGVSVSRSMIF
ncbi:hypothetical protein B0T20DRAFT_245174 [Sordaria brevicollis]|uniref:F-box domain-containing protein n=1 Tax=Sordaria brevicollis TaxID=83679 RepID=A0AAE0UAI7_SORBR|nr:hypothetical protein B0T20DRAFT_245174 [Sordaria brevicollis]